MLSWLAYTAKMVALAMLRLPAHATSSGSAFQRALYPSCALDLSVTVSVNINNEHALWYRVHAARSRPVHYRAPQRDTTVGSRSRLRAARKPWASPGPEAASPSPSDPTLRHRRAGVISKIWFDFGSILVRPPKTLSERPQDPPSDGLSPRTVDDNTRSWRRGCWSRVRVGCPTRCCCVDR